MAAHARMMMRYSLPAEPPKSDGGIQGFFIRKVTKFGNSARVDCPNEYPGRTVYLVGDRMTLNRDRIFRTITTLDTFVNHCLDLKPKGPRLLASSIIGTVESREGHCIDSRGLCGERPMKPPGFSGSITPSTFSFSRRTEG